MTHKEAAAGRAYNRSAKHKEAEGKSKPKGSDYDRSEKHRKRESAGMKKAMRGK